MRQVKLPIIGQVAIGKADETPAVIEQPKKEVKTVQKLFDTLGGVLDLTRGGLSNEKTISGKLLKANREWVYRNNDVIAKEVSKMEFELFSIGLKNGEVELKEVETHPVLELLDQFNSSTTKSDALYITQSHKKLTGDCFWLLIKNKGIVTSIYPLPPDKVEIILGNPTDASDDIIEGYKYTDVIDGKKIDQTYTKDQIIHFKTPNPDNPFRGLGVVEALAETIDLDNLTTNTTKKFYQNGAITNFVLSSEAKLNDDQLKRLRGELKSTYGGSRNAFKTMILGGGLKPVDISYSNRDMQFLDQLAWYRDKIMAGFGNNLAVLGVLDDVNRATHESSTVEWKRNTVKPEMDAIVDTLNEFFVPMFGDKLLLGYEDPVPEDRGAKIDEAVRLKSANIITVNEAREILDLDPIQGGEELTQPQDNSRPNDDKKPSKILIPNLKVHLRKRGFYQIKQYNQELKEIAKPLAKKIIENKKNKRVADNEPPKYQRYTNEQVKTYWEKQVQTIEVIEGRFLDKLEKFLDIVMKNALDNLSTFKSSKKKNVLDEEELLVRAELDFIPLLMDEAVIAGQYALDLINSSSPYIPLDIRTQIHENVAKFTQSMISSDAEFLGNLINDGLASGKSIPQIRDEITANFGNYTKNQAQLIARTEVARVANQASLDAWKQSGLVEGKQWVTFGAVDECDDYDGDIVYNLDGNFYSDTGEFKDGDPPLHPNCKCIVIPIVDGFKTYTPRMEKEKLLQRIEELEKAIDKRTKAFKELQADKKDLQEYVIQLEAIADELDTGE